MLAIRVPAVGRLENINARRYEAGNDVRGSAGEAAVTSASF